MKRATLKLRVERTGQLFLIESFPVKTVGNQVLLVKEHGPIIFQSNSLPKEPMRYCLEVELATFKFRVDFGDTFQPHPDGLVTMYLPTPLAVVV